MLTKTTHTGISSKEKDIILDSITEGVFTVNCKWLITSFNRASENITGIFREEAMNQPCRNVLRANICETNCALEETIRTGKPIVGRAATIINSEGKRIPISISTAILNNKHDEVIGGVETFRDLTMIENLRKEIERDYNFEDIISRSHCMQEIFSILPEIAESTSTVLIEGESGTGKELFAKAIHNLSPRREKPFIAINSGALPDTLLESELFGYEKGAFTDARKDKPGRIALAEGGTLFLDEIGDVSPALQVRLLRFLQEKVYEPLGSVTSVRADVRIITATNHDLSDLVQEKRFREDLYYRVNVVGIKIPPLRERMEDIPILIDHFIARFNRIQDKEVTNISNEALTCLMSYDFPGNVRELENIIERSFVLCRSGLIERMHLPEPVYITPYFDCLKQEEFTSMEQMEASFIINTLRRNNWNRLEAARQLGIHKTTLYRKIKSLGLDIPSSRKQS